MRHAKPQQSAGEGPGAHQSGASLTRSLRVMMTGAGPWERDAREHKHMRVGKRTFRRASRDVWLQSVLLLPTLIRVMLLLR